MKLIEVQERDNSIDIFRGIAMLLVVFGHTLSTSIDNYQQTFVFNIIWTLQMPMFMVISGYVTMFSKEIKSVHQLGRFLLKRTVTYVIPWIVWTFLIRGFIFSQKQLLDPAYLFWHMDSGYWFLTSLWTLCVIYGISQFFANILYKKDNKVINFLIFSIFSLFCVGCLALIGRFLGISFFGIKLSLYYFPFFMIGVFFSRVNNSLGKNRIYERIKEIVIILLALIYISLLLRFNFAMLEDNFSEIGLRYIASLTGCAAIFGLGSKFLQFCKSSNLIMRCLSWIGLHSLEIYLIHGLVLSPLRTTPCPQLHTLTGVLYTLFNFLITLLISSSLLSLINCNEIAGKVIFGKRIV